MIASGRVVAFLHSEYAKDIQAVALRPAECLRLAAELVQLSPDLIVASGYGELMPVACNADEPGRAKNRRVEVWLATR